MQAIRSIAVVLALIGAGFIASPAFAGPDEDRLLQIRERGVLDIAVYRDFPPYSYAGSDGRYVGLDVDIGQMLAKELGLTARVRPFTADEDLNDDLRNQIWRGPLLGGGIADVMLRVGMDPRFIERQQRRVEIFNAYGHERLAVVYNEKRIGAVATPLDLSRGKVAVEIDSMSDYYTSGAFNGRLREQAIRQPSLTAAVALYLEGKADAVMAPRGELEGVMHVAGESIEGAIAITEFAGMFRTAWDVGMAIQADNPQLRDALIAALDKIRADGRLDAAFERHGMTAQRPDPANLQVGTR